jgi:hypothetical protein
MLLASTAALIGVQVAVVPGINLALSDLLLAALMLVLVIRHRAAFVAAIRPTTPVHAATLALLGALLWGSAVTYARTGELGRDVWLNKDLGWLVLASIIVAVRATIRSTDDAVHLLRWIVIGALLVEASAALLFIATGGGPSGLRFDGLLLNPNANGAFLSVALFVLIGATRDDRLFPFGSWTVRLAAGFLTLLLVATLSRGTWIAAIAALVIVAVTLMRRTPLLPATCAAVLVLFSIQPLTAALTPLWAQIARGQVPASERDFGPGDTLPPNLGPLIAGVTPRPASSQRPSQLPTRPPSATPNYLDAAQAIASERFGASDRVALNILALKLWLAAPATALTGIGLGVFARVTPFVFGVPVIIHSTYLWLPVEMGLPGIAALCSLLFAGVWVVKRTTKFGGTGLAVALTGSLLLLAFWSGLNEGTYQRALWFLLAIGSVLVSHAPREIEKLSGAP